MAIWGFSFELGHTHTLLVDWSSHTHRHSGEDVIPPRFSFVDWLFLISISVSAGVCVVQCSVVLSRVFAMKGALDRTKVVLRHLPPSLSEASLLSQIDASFSGRYNWLSFRPGKIRLFMHSFITIYTWLLCMFLIITLVNSPCPCLGYAVSVVVAYDILSNCYNTIIYVPLQILCAFRIHYRHHIYFCLHLALL